MHYLSKSRHGTWRFRIVVPPHLRAAFPELPRDTSISLATVDRRHYAGVARIMTAAWWMVRSALESAMSLPRLTNYTLTDVVHPDGRRQRTLTTSPTDTAEQLRDALAFLERTGTPLPGPVQRLAERLAGIAERTPIATTPTTTATPAATPAAVAANDASASGPWLSESIESWRLEQQELHIWKVAGTWTNTYAPALRDFRELIAHEQRVVGTSAEAIWDLPMAQLDRNAVDTYIHDVRRLPKQQGKRPDGRDAKARLKAALPPQPLATANKKINMVKTFIRWAIEQELVAKNVLRPFASALRGGVPEPEAGYLAFSTDEVSHILAATSSPRAKLEWRYWAPRIALYTGARVREIADLTVDDIVDEAGFSCIWFRGGEVTSGRGDSCVKRVKTTSSERVVPIAGSLIDAGLLDYVRRCRELGRIWLWDGLAWTDKDGHARGITRWFAEVLRRAGIKHDRRKTFHSFRSTVLQALDRVGLDTALRARVVGHDDRSTAGRHYQRSPSGRPAMPVARVKEALDAIDWGSGFLANAGFGVIPNQQAGGVGDGERRSSNG